MNKVVSFFVYLHFIVHFGFHLSVIVDDCIINIYLYLQPS